jgi:hypothetical protein
MEIVSLAENSTLELDKITNRPNISLYKLYALRTPSSIKVSRL